MKTRVFILQLHAWVVPAEWPESFEFCVLVIAEGILRNQLAYTGLIRSAVLNGANSLYFWGPDAEKAADSAVFSIAEEEYVHVRSMKRESFMTVQFKEKSAAETIELIVHSYLPDAVGNSEKSLLIVCGLEGASSTLDFCEALKRSSGLVELQPALHG